MEGILVNHVVRAATAACRSFARYQSCYFQFDRRPGYRGWENWLTVEIARELHTRAILPFFEYPSGHQRLDLFAEDERAKLAVEIKVNYLDNREIEARAERGTEFPDRILADRDKLDSLGAGVGRLLLVATCFESRDGLQTYPRLIQASLRRDFGFWRAQWRDCSRARDRGWNLLLALSRSA